MAASQWQRIAPGLYVDPSGRWVVTRDARRFYTVRRLTGWGPTMTGEQFPDYDDVHHYDAPTLAEARAAVENGQV